MDKKELRGAMRILNRDITAEERLKHSSQILHTIEALPQFREAHTIALFSALPDEPQTEQALTRWSKSLAKELLLPKVMGQTTIEFFRYEPESPERLKIGAFGILEPKAEPTTEQPANPSEIDIIVIPGLAFTKDGHRLGRGKGYYDRYLARLNAAAPHALKIGLCYPHQIVEKMPCEQHDIKLDIVIFE